MNSLHTDYSKIDMMNDVKHSKRILSNYVTMTLIRATVTIESGQASGRKHDESWPF